MKNVRDVIYERPLTSRLRFIVCNQIESVWVFLPVKIIRVKNIRTTARALLTEKEKRKTERNLRKERRKRRRRRKRLKKREKWRE